MSYSSATGVDFKQHTEYGTITPFDVTGISTISNSALNIYPNPAANLLTIQWNEKMTGDATIVITDMLGREVFSSVVPASGASQLNISGLKAGIYMISVLAEHLHVNDKLEIRK